MKTKILLLLLVSFLTLSFTITPDVVPEDPIAPKEICLTISEVSDLENLLLDEDVYYNITIVWTGDAAYNASMNFQSIRNTVRTNYELNHGKLPFHMVIDNNHESWTFNGSHGRGDVEATMQSDPNVDCTDCD